MPEKQIQVARDGVMLGIMTASEAAELLQLGLLKREDQFHYDGQMHLKPISELPVEPQSSAGKSKWFASARNSLSTARSAVVHVAGDLAGKAKSFAGTTQAGAASVTDKLLSGFLPQIQKIVSKLTRTKPFQTLHSGVHDDQLMLKVFGAAYDCLPKPICRFIPEQQFVLFCMKHRAELLRSKSSEPNDRT